MLKGKVYYKKCHRHHEPGQAHELTFSCFQNQKFLSRNRTRQWLIDSIKYAREKYHFSLWAYVIMPNHVHLLIFPKDKHADIGKILQAIKQPVAQKAIAWLKQHNPKGLEKLTTGQKHRKYRFWQDGGGYDRNIIQKDTLLHTVRYIHLNPVRRELVKVPEEWPYSSASAWNGTDSLLKVDLDSFPQE